MDWPTSTMLAALVGAALALVLLSLWHLRYWTRRFDIPMEYASVERLRTQDGSVIELRRLAEPADDSTRPPVLLVHGLGANHRNNDLMPDRSLARYLAEAGRDVWLLTLRSGMTSYRIRQLRKVRFRAMVMQDLPLAVETVRKRTGARAIDYVGFSMGGMLLYAALGHTIEADHLRRVAIVGSPAIIRTPIRLPKLVARWPDLLVPTLRLRLLGRFWVFAAEWVKTPLHRIVLNPDNVAPGVAQRSMVNLVADVPGPLNLDFAAWAVSDDGVLTLDGETVLERLKDVSVPVLFFAGAGDRLAPPSAVRAAYDAWGANTGVEKSFVVLGTEAGAHADYGHGDLAIGTYVVEDVFAPLCRFLAKEARS